MENKGKQKERYPANVLLVDFYNYYAAKHFAEKKEGKKRSIIDRDSEYYITKDIYSKIISELNLAVSNMILTENLEFKMPARMGSIGIRKRIPKTWFDKNGKLINTMPPDWKATKDLWASDPDAKEKKKLVRHLNKHSNGYTARWFYNKLRATYKWKSAYCFLPCRTNQRKLTAILKDEDSTIDYYLK